MTAVPPRPAAPDVSTDTGALREALVEALRVDTYPPFWQRGREGVVDLLLPALRDLIAERDQAVAAAGRVRELADWLDKCADDTDHPNLVIGLLVAPKVLDVLGRTYRDDARRIRRALDGAT